MSVGEVVVGKVVGAFGVNGWLKIQSFTQPFGNILLYSPWVLMGSDGSAEFSIRGSKLAGKGIVVALAGIDDRDQALALRGSEIRVSRECFGELEGNQYYWIDLIGLSVETESGFGLGNVSGMMETGANDVMVIDGDRQRLIPFLVPQYVKSVNLDDKIIKVDWDPDF